MSHSKENSSQYPPVEKKEYLLRGLLEDQYYYSKKRKRLTALYSAFELRTQLQPPEKGISVYLESILSALKVLDILRISTAVARFQAKNAYSLKFQIERDRIDHANMYYPNRSEKNKRKIRRKIALACEIVLERKENNTN